MGIVGTFLRCFANRLEAVQGTACCLSLRGVNRPNLLLITSDQQHWTTLGVANPKILTPNLDRLAAMGVRCTRAYCPNPTCTPTRASLLTGMYPSVHGAYTLGTKLPEDRPTIGNHLRDLGYRTALIGKAHFQPLKSTADCESVEAYPTLRDLDFWRTFNDLHAPWYGFDHVELARNHADEGHVGQHYALWLEAKGLTDWRDYFHPRQDGVVDTPSAGSKAPPDSGGPGYGWRGDMRWKLPADLHYTAWTAERTNALIEQFTTEGKPWFVWSSYHDPHPPYAVSEPWASLYDPTDMESEVGRFVEGEFDDMPPPHRLTREAEPDFDPYGFGIHGYHSHTGISRDDLRRAVAVYYGMISFMDEQIGKTLDLLEKTGQIDNTLIVFTSDHGHFYGQHGLVAKGPFHYEDGIRVPFLAAMKGRIPANITENRLISLVDVPATFVAAATGGVPLWMQGRNQLPSWSGGEPAREALFVENHHSAGPQVHLRTLVTSRHKLTLYRGRPDWGELFDLEIDPGETQNLYHRDPTLRAKLMEQFVQADLDREPTPVPRVTHA